MKTRLRNEMLAAAALALCVLVFTGCSKNETETASLDTASTSSEKGVTSTVSSVPASSSHTESVVSSAEPESKVVSQFESKPESTTTSESESTPAPKTESKSESTTTSETDSKPAPEPEPTPEWTEEPASGAYYINTDYVSAREKALVGAKAVGTFSLNDQVTVVAKTSTGYYKMLNGYFIHGDYLSTTKTEAQKPATSVPFVPAEQPSSGPKDGDTKVENGKTYVWISGPDIWVEDSGPGGNVGPDLSGIIGDPNDHF